MLAAMPDAFPNHEPPTQGIRNTREGITDLHEMIAAVIGSALVDEALRAQLGAARRYEGATVAAREKASRKRELALHA